MANCLTNPNKVIYNSSTLKAQYNNATRKVLFATSYIKDSWTCRNDAYGRGCFTSWNSCNGSIYYIPNYLKVTISGIKDCNTNELIEENGIYNIPYSSGSGTWRHWACVLSGTITITVSFRTNYSSKDANIQIEDGTYRWFFKDLINQDCAIPKTFTNDYGIGDCGNMHGPFERAGYDGTVVFNGWDGVSP